MWARTLICEDSGLVEGGKREAGVFKKRDLQTGRKKKMLSPNELELCSLAQTDRLVAAAVVLVH
jgi:hypothetical protein